MWYKIVDQTSGPGTTKRKLTDFKERAESKGWIPFTFIIYDPFNELAPVAKELGVNFIQVEEFLKQVGAIHA